MSAVDHLTCQEFVEVLTDYLECALDADERAEIERHIVICRGCTNYVEQTRATIELLGRVGAEDDVDGDGLLATFREWRAGRP
jgi:anti-sigma factor RsiW